MSVDFTHQPRPRLPLRHRPAALVAVGIAHLIARQSPLRIQTVLTHVRRGARPATAVQAKAARDAVIAVSLSCAGEGCLPRSIATALLCRTHGVWPTWRTGVHIHPFTAHAWVEADGHPIDEPHPPGYYIPNITIAPCDDQGKRPISGRGRRRR
ncbi:lasso peptide biosynthesis B2 protein [Nonomuraea basaltis]|uniref:lasso peptide biosynthesis B2 protein n=1 Tax=Nonomuraea basaltis TaxID=2495887 RepID=UPI00110C5C5E|nr:lasso peptide biosynthesis B2 protein [Nonomuraea basaltis]TMR99098.1 lasso peptide biosynthesis B2 protein [Nonomuraea basaltis]